MIWIEFKYDLNKFEYDLNIIYMISNYNVNMI